MSSPVPQRYHWPARVSRLDRWLLPDAHVAAEFSRLNTAGDPVAERFVDETFLGELGPSRSRALLDEALLSGVPADAPESMRVLFAEFEEDPPWLDRDLVERGAAVWRRWGYALGAIGNAGTMDSYTEASLAVPLSLAGGYAGHSALNRYLETTRWWIEVCRPGAITTPGSDGRALSMKVRVMHVSVRRRVAAHPEWDSAAWGLPISQAEMMLTLLGGSVAPALGLTMLGYLTSPTEMRAVLHFNRYLGHLVGVRCDAVFPQTAAEALRLLWLFHRTRAYDAGEVGRELVESFVPAFEPSSGLTGSARLRALLHIHLQAGYARLFMLPGTRRRYGLPSGVPGAALLLARSPAVVAVELARRVSPRVDERWQSWSHARWERWLVWQSGNKRALFDASAPLRRT